LAIDKINQQGIAKEHKKGEEEDNNYYRSL